MPEFIHLDARDDPALWVLIALGFILWIVQLWSEWRRKRRKN